MLLNNEWVKNEIREEIRMFLETTGMNSQQSKTNGHSKGSPEREVHSNQAYLKRIETFQINNLPLHLQELEEQ